MIRLRPGVPPRASPTELAHLCEALQLASVGLGLPLPSVTDGLQRIAEQLAHAALQ